MTPAIRTAGSNVASPCTIGAMVWAMPAALTTRITGSPVARASVGGGTAAARLAVLGTIEQAHHAFDDEDVGAVRLIAIELIEQCRPHRPQCRG